MNNEKSKINIYELAKQTGFSVSTVSKAINNTGRISKATKDKILEKAQELNYVASYHAKALSSKKSWIIAVIHTDNLGTGLTHPHFSVILESFKQQVEQAGYEVTFVNRNMGNSKLSYLDFCRYRNVEGVFLVNYYGFSRQIPELIESNIPVISAEIGEGVVSVTSDDLQGGRLAAKYLLDLGHKSFVHISGPLEVTSSLNRYEAFKDELEQNNVSDIIHYEATNFGFEDGYQNALKMILENKVPSAIFAGADLLALGAIKALKENNIRVPEDVSVLGYDDLVFLKYNTPALTTIAQDKSQIGVVAANALMDEISGITQSSKTIDVTIIERETCMRKK